MMTEYYIMYSAEMYYTNLILCKTSTTTAEANGGVHISDSIHYKKCLALHFKRHWDQV